MPDAEPSTGQDAPASGMIPYAAGQSTLVRIPIPGTDGLCIEFWPRGHIPSGGSTSTLFFQDARGGRHLRLDFGYNIKTRSINYHWNQKGTYSAFETADHTVTGRAGAALYEGARYFRYAGRVLLVAGVAIDLVSIVEADKPMRRASEVVAGWAGAWAGCEVAGAGGAAIGILASPIGTAIGGVGGCIIGGVGGYLLGTSAGDVVYDWAEDTLFTPLPQVDGP